MKKMNLMSSIIAVIISISASAEELPMQMSGGMTFSAFDDNMGQTEALGYKASVGYNINENVLFELGYADFSAFSGPEKYSLEALMIETDFILPISEYASLYTGMGGALLNDDTSLTTSIGLKYQLTQNWYADIGYQGIFDLAEQKDDLYVFNTQVIYRFSRGKKIDSTKDVELSSDLNSDSVVEEKDLALSLERKQQTSINIEKERSCQVKLTEYEIVSGDHLMELTRRFNISMDELIKVNSNLNHRNINLIYPDEKIFYPKSVCTN
ncbi:outer membrane beta-barrel protein [Vibrio chagasii]|uniref:outer membrane beta-barrel protein n=1 Tax=Vibrio chagasii TaxID=170679 RepID=UPI004067C4C2